MAKKSNIQEKIQNLEFLEAIIYVGSVVINFNFTRVALVVKTNIKNKEVTFLVYVGQEKTKEFIELEEACIYFNEIINQK